MWYEKLVSIRGFATNNYYTLMIFRGSTLGSTRPLPFSPRPYRKVQGTKLARIQTRFRKQFHVPLGEAVFSPNLMWYRPIWSCDFRCNLHGLQSSGIGHTGDRVSLAEPDSHTKSGRESGDTRVLSWCCTVSKSVGN